MNEMTTNQYEELSIGIAAALQQRRQSGKKRLNTSGQGARQRMGEKRSKKSALKNDANDTGSGYQGKSWLP